MGQTTFNGVPYFFSYFSIFEPYYAQEDVHSVNSTRLVFLDRYNEFSIDLLIYCLAHFDADFNARRNVDDIIGDVSIFIACPFCLNLPLGMGENAMSVAQLWTSLRSESDFVEVAGIEIYANRVA